MATRRNPERSRSEAVIQATGNAADGFRWREEIQSHGTSIARAKSRNAEQHEIADPDVQWSGARDSGLVFTKSDVVVPFPKRIETAVQAVAQVLQDVSQSIDPRQPSSRRPKPKGKAGRGVVLPIRVEAVHATIDAPGFTDGADVYINIGHAVDTEKASLLLAREKAFGFKASPWQTFDIGALKGLVYHEVSHILFTGRDNHVRRTVSASERLQRAWNLLEDQRIETLFVAEFPGAAALFTRTVAEYLLKDSDETIGVASLWTHGRRYLSAELRSKLHDASKVSAHNLTEAYALIDQFQAIDPEVHVGGPNIDQTRIVLIVEEFAKYLERALEDAGATGSALPEQVQSAATQSHKLLDRGAPRPPSAGAQERVLDIIQAETKAGEPVPFDGQPEEPLSGSLSDSGSEGTGDPTDSSESAGVSGSEEGQDPASSSGDPSKGWSYSPGTDEAPAGSPNSRTQEAEQALGQALARAVEAESVNEAAIKRAALDLVGDQSTLDPAVIALSPVSSDGRKAVRDFTHSLKRISNDVIPHREKRTSRGIINVRRWEQEHDIDTAFDAWNPGREADVQLEAVILLDRSDSMHSRIAAASEAAWSLKASIEQAHAGSVSVLTFNNAAQELYRASERVSRTHFRSVRSSGGTNPIDALIEGYRILSGSRKALRLLVILTDGQFGAARNDEVIERLRKAGVTTVLVDLTHSWAGAKDSAFLVDPDALDGHGCEFIAQCGDIDSFREAFTKVCGELRHRALHQGRPSRWWKNIEAERKRAFSASNV